VFFFLEMPLERTCAAVILVAARLAGLSYVVIARALPGNDLLIIRHAS
jgi:hypothetical protein